MNLALESLIRNKVIENSFHTQCSIAVWDEFKNNPLWITVKKEETSDKFLITHWRIDLFQEVDCINYKSNDDYELPISTYFLVSSENLFKPNKVIPKGLKPIRIISSSVSSHLNSYKKPMSQDVYESYFENILNPSLHLEYKKCWLWNYFMFNSKNSDTELRERIQDYLFYNDIEEFVYLCQEEMNQYFYDINDLWQNIQKELFIKEPEATGELVFASTV